MRSSVLAKIRAILVIYVIASTDLSTPAERNALAHRIVRLWKEVTVAINHGTSDEKGQEVNGALVPPSQRI